MLNWGGKWAAHRQPKKREKRARKGEKDSEDREGEERAKFTQTKESRG